MLEARRKFLLGLAVVTPLLGLAAQSGPEQFPNKPALPRPEDPEKGDAPPPGVLKSRLAGNDKDMKKKVERLFQLASELKEQVEKTDSSQVLSLALVKKAEEIEKLAKEIKNRSAG